MATEIQYTVFKSVHDEETKRRSELRSKANLYLTVITAYLGLIGFKAADII